jgi:hypothetical protein
LPRWHGEDWLYPGSKPEIIRMDAAKLDAVNLALVCKYLRKYDARKNDHDDEMFRSERFFTGKIP